MGHSAGGVIASLSIPNLPTDVDIEIHTIASPLNGFHIPEKYTFYDAGIIREISLGIEPYQTPTSNIKVYHHKTITDQVITNFCQEYAKYCDPLKVQNNNVPTSSEYYYPSEDHNSIVMFVGKKIISCN